MRRLFLLICLLHAFVNAKADHPNDSLFGTVDYYNQYYKLSDAQYKFRISVSTFFILNGGWGFSIGAGSWVDIKGIQPSLAVNLVVYAKGNSLGNALFYGDEANTKRGDSPSDLEFFNPNRTLATIMFSPMLTRRLGKAKYTFEEINPFYFGGSSVIFSPYRNAITIGTTFITMPKGTYNNIMTARNRSQQLLYIQYRADGFQINVYEDYLLFTDQAWSQWLCDNRDRYYTGGANVQVRLSPFARLKFYSEMYTGSSYVDKQDYPDLAFPNSQPAHMLSRKKADAINRKYAYQQPGQKAFNRARNFLCFEYALQAKMYQNHIASDFFNYSSIYNHNVQLIYGKQNGQKSMFQQNFIHNLNSIDRDSKSHSKKSHPSSLHHFDFTDNFLPKRLFGFGTNSAY